VYDPSTSNVDQRRASPAGDNVGRDKIINNQARKSQVEGWLDKLADQLRDNAEVRHFVDSLQYYFQSYPYDSVVGLEAKLDHAGRSREKLAALRRKEAFSKLLEEWKAYPAAQEIIAYFLSKIEVAFETQIAPMLGQATNGEIDKAVEAALIIPVLDEMGCGPFMLNYMNVSGMVYWLAEQCYIRWHA
jgi:hypothetical protein